MDRREKELIQRLLKPMDGERLLDVGCGAGNYLRFFRGKGCSVTGTDQSQHMLDMAREKLGQRADLCPGDSENLPFSDNEFDIVTLIFPNPACNLQNTINEAIRVCRGRIFLGTINRYSPASAYGMEKAALYSYGSSHTSSIPEMTRLIRLALSNTTIKWGSVIFFPPRWYPSISFFEERIPIMKNPFGSFIGLAFPVTYNRITIQDPLGETSEAKAAGGYPAPGAARRRTGE
ncbi:MAG: class I SAM-dependent methyltransferase [Syntrophobacterales bacterium]|nr:class I SAM-dependent methyltransferase [Syntrophobacterales bacterium]